MPITVSTRRRLPLATPALLFAPTTAWAQGGGEGGTLWLWLLAGAALAVQTLLIVSLQRSRLRNKRVRRQLKAERAGLQERVEERTERLEQEVAQHQATELLLRETQDYLHSLINAMPSVLIGVTPEGRVTHWNAAAEQATGLSSGQALDRPLAEVYPDLPVSLETIRQTIHSGEALVNENLQQGRGSEARYADLGIYPLISVQAVGAVIRLDDITKRVRIENMMIQNEKMMSLGELAAGMAHEINNPLSTVLHGVQNIQRRTSTELTQNRQVAEEEGTSMASLHAYLERRRVLRFLEDIREAGERSMQIVSNMLEFSRDNSQPHEHFDLARIVEHTLTLSDSALEPVPGRRPRIELAMAESLPPVAGSAAEIQQVLLNLLRNAAQSFADAELARAPAITISGYAEGGSVVLAVADNGPGMPEQVRRHIFEPFFTTKEVGQGTGLGLSVSYFIVTEHHAGSIEVDSVPGEGTRFTIRLPQYQQTEHHRNHSSLSQGSSS